MSRFKFIVFAFVWALMMVSSTFAADEKSEQAAVVKSFKQFAADLMVRFKDEKHEIVRSLPEIRCMSSKEEIFRFMERELSRSKADPNYREVPVFRKELYEPDTEYSIDVRKTESLISPYVGFIEFKWHEHDGDCAQTKEEAEAKPFHATGVYQTYRYTYAFQDGTWVPEGRQIHHEDPSELEDCKDSNERDFGCHVSDKPQADEKKK